MGKVACQKLMRVSWRTVGPICPRAEARLSGARPPVPGGPVRIGVDETSCRKGCRCMAAIVDHGTEAAVRCHGGHGKEAFGEFLPGLAEEQRASIELVSADGARWAGEAMAGWLPGAAGCIGTFHVVHWATDLLDEVRKQAWREAARAARKEPARRRGRPGKGEEAPCGKRKAAAVKGLGLSCKLLVDSGMAGTCSRYAQAGCPPIATSRLEQRDVRERERDREGRIHG